MKSKKFIIFDLDGTLIDSSGDIAWTANETLKEMGLETRSVDYIKDCIGWGVWPLMEKLLPGASVEVINHGRDIFLKHYAGHLTVETVLYNGIYELLNRIKDEGKGLGIVTNKPISLTEIIVSEVGIKDFFSIIFGGDSFENKKPHPEPILKVMASKALEPKDFVMVGDSKVDIEAGKGAGIETIGVAYGFRGAGELEKAGASIIVESVEELSSTLI